VDVAAVLDPRGQPPAVVVLKVYAEKVLYPLIQSWPSPSLTSETLLVKLEEKAMPFLNELRHRKKTALSLRVPLIPSCAHTGNLLCYFLGAHLNVLPKEGDPPGRPYKNLYYFYERNLV
jgi:hypothetical protein